MPGKVVRVLLAEGSEVQAGGGVMVVEAMKMQNELKAPRAGVVRKILVTEGDNEVCKVADEVIYIPAAPDLLSPILEIVPMQLLAYHIAVRRGCDVDQPRNLAKSVTVE